ncbi:RidA family protein [Methanomassiliicoccus luminyensis]|uniref:RidA family protein n=1 Tax=Methanomassiliicoccus luminyensis TaxID=1080712 RepID=UPI0003678394|nr:RidA family protein [Methanomassiliicoccus luminyensis]
MGRAVYTKEAPNPVGPYSQAVKAGGLVFCSGQLGLDPRTGKFAGESAGEQTKQALENIKAVLEEAGSSMMSVVKTIIFVTDMNDFKDVNEVYAAYFEFDPPARSTVGVAKLPLGGKVEIEAIATLG